MNTHRFTVPQVFDHETNPEAFPNLMEASEYLKSLPIERRRELEEEWGDMDLLGPMFSAI